MTGPTPSEAEDLLAGLLEQYSPSTCEQAAVQYLVTWARAHGLSTEIDGAGNAVITAGAGERTVLLLGHIDTVPGAIEVRRDGDRLYGRGAVDAKGPLAAFVTAAARAAIPAGTRVVVVGAVEEEAATSKGARFLLDRLAPDAVVIGEPSGWDRLTVGYKGRLLVDYTLEVDNGHTAGPDGGACDAAFAFWTAALAHASAFNAERPRVFDQISPSLRAMRSTNDGLVDAAALTLGFRLPPGLDPADMEPRLIELAGPASLQFRGQELAYHADKSTPLARAFVRAIDAEDGRARFAVKSGTSDMNVVGSSWSCPMLAYGPGDSRLDHTPEEHIDLAEYHRAISVLTRVLGKA
ncbi:MAG: [LysW]-lysine hydrolase [Anaerolineae bacterium]|jgi:LysW-gamma-L-lysine carboxypeptidase|nr:[LysW]-lysine hydrolase [Anaerolineae bacterium]